MRNNLRKGMIWSVGLAALLLIAVSFPRDARAQSGQAEPVKITGDIKPPTVVKQVRPVYPEEARKKRIEGTVILEATVDVKGAVKTVKVLESVPALDQAAMDAVKQWVYEPKVIEGKPVPVVFTVTVRFLLDKDKGVKEAVEGKETEKAAGGEEPPTLIKKVDPVYPEEARKQRIEGSVILELSLDAKGKVQNAKILRSIPALDQAAVDAVKQWVYEPKVIDGKPVPVVCTVTIRFKLK